MSRLQKWTVPFTSLKGEVYSVRIYEEDYVGSPTTLEPAGDTLAVSMENTEEIIMQVRGQSGYLRLMETGITPTIITTSNSQHFVELVKNSVVVWQGYIQAAAYTSQYDSSLHEVEYPLMSPLKLLESKTVTESAGSGMMSVAALIREAIIESGATFSTITFPIDVTGLQTDAATTSDDNLAMLRTMVSRYNFLSINNDNVEDEDCEEFSGVTWYTVLEEICKFFGMSLVEDGTSLIFTNEISTNYARLTYSQLTSLVNGSAVVPTIITRDEDGLTFSAETLAGSDNTVQIRQGARKVIINAEVKNQETPISSPPYDEKHLDEEVTVTLRASENITRKSRFQTFSDNLLVRCHMYDGTSEIPYVPASAHSQLLGTRGDIIRMDQWETDDPSKINYSFTDAIRLCCTFGAASLTDYNVMKDKSLVTLLSPGIMSLRDGCLCINSGLRSSMLAYSYNGITQQWNPSGSQIDNDGETMFGPAAEAKIRLSVRIGNKYFNGSTWNTAPAILTLDVNDTNMDLTCNLMGQTGTDWPFGTGKIKNTKTLAMPYNGAEGYIIPIAGELVGRLQIDIYPWRMYMRDFGTDIISQQPVSIREPGYRAVFLTDFSVGYFNDSSETKRSGQSNRYSALTGKDFTEDAEFKLSLATNDRNQSGSTLITYNGSYIRKMTFTSGTEIPEMHLLDRLKTLHQKTRSLRKMQMEYSTDFAWLTLYDDDWFITGIDRNFAGGSCSLTICSKNG